LQQAKPIRLSAHARQQLAYRGVQEEEVVECIRTAAWEPAELGRLQCAKDYPFEAEWNEVFYTTERVQPIFADRGGSGKLDGGDKWMSLPEDGMMAPSETGARDEQTSPT
jgi:hypothetical protein